MTSTRSPAIRLARRVLLPETEMPVADLVDTAVRRRLLSLTHGDAVVVVTIPDGSRGGDPLPVAMLARIGKSVAGGIALIGERRVRLERAPRGPSGQAVWSPLTEDDRGGVEATMREITAHVELSKRVTAEVGSALRNSLAHKSHWRKAVAHTADRCLALPGLGVAFEVQALALVEIDVDKRLALLGAEVRRLIEGKPLDPTLAKRVDAATAGVPFAADAKPSVPAIFTGTKTPTITPKSARPKGAVVWGERYVVEGILGKGGQGTTWKALDERTGDTVALKAFDLAKATEWKKVELFEREVATLKELAHARIPRLLDVVDHPDKQSRALVMTFVPGSDLETLVNTRGPFTPSEVGTVLEQMLEVLAELHSRGVVHRDVKPRNIIRRPDGAEHTLVDFGGVTRAKDTAGSTIVGTFGFMAPEQLYGAQSAATDLYALGATALALATAKQPEELPRKGLGIDVDAALPSAMGPYSPELRRALSSMLEPDPEKRAKDASVVRAALGGGGGIRAWWRRITR